MSRRYRPPAAGAGGVGFQVAEGSEDPPGIAVEPIEGEGAGATLPSVKTTWLKACAGVSPVSLWGELIFSLGHRRHRGNDAGRRVDGSVTTSWTERRSAGTGLCPWVRSRRRRSAIQWSHDAGAGSRRTDAWRSETRR